MCINKPSVSAPPPVPEVPEPPAAAPRPSDPAAKAARNKEKKLLASQSGRKSTILTGPRGDESEAETGKKTLLGN